MNLPFPYESLSAYYSRASYGKLSLTGETFDYAAKYERDYYTNNPKSLVAEALAALDESEDLSRFDANEDGKLDAVYVHFAGPDTGWGSVWWSNESTASDPDALRGRLRPPFGTWSCWQKTPATPGPPAPLFTKQATCSDCPTITAREARRDKVSID